MMLTQILSDYASPEEASRIRGSSTYLTVINSLTEFLEVIDQVNSGCMCYCAFILTQALIRTDEECSNDRMGLVHV